MRDRGHESYDYFRYEGRDWRYFEGTFRRMRPVPPVLDVGSGLGLFVECCRHHGVEAIGVELSREGIAASTSKRLPVVRADLSCPLPFRDSVFGSAFVHQVLEHIPKDHERAVLREIRRTLRPGGFVFAVSPSVHHPKAREDPDHINLFAPHELVAELRDAGFRRSSLRNTFWYPFWDPDLKRGRVTILIAGLLWRIAPIDRFAGTVSAVAWK